MDLLMFTVMFVVCLQVYNEQIRDLLANAGPLAVREDSSKGVVVQGLTLHQVSRNMYQTHSPTALQILKGHIILNFSLILFILPVY